MNDILRLALVINTSHSQFMDNLIGVILYIINIEKNNYNGLTIFEIRKSIVDNICLDFSETEIKQAINKGIKENKIDKISKNRYSVGPEGIKSINYDYEEGFEEIIKKYIEINNITEYNEEQIFGLISNYIYNCLNENIDLIMKLLKKEKISLQIEISRYQSNYSEEDKRIINNFLDWNNKEKNEMVYKLVSFSVDYCRLTVKQNLNTFKGFFNGKRFYMDANIIFRLMGINNQERQSTIIEFVTKCNNVGVKLVYSNFTKQEIFDSFEYNVDRLKHVLKDLKASPAKINELFEPSDHFAFYEKYHQWSVENNRFKDFEGFNQYLKTSFFEYVSTYKLKQEDFENFSITATDTFMSYVKSLADYKTINENEPRMTTVKFDIQNVLNVQKIRARSKDGTAWSINQYIISADRKLIEWSNEVFIGETSYVVYPSVWYSLILKVCGRTDDDSKSFNEFMKVRYNSEPSTNLISIIANISEITDNALLQDQIIDELVQDNKRVIREIIDTDDVNIPELVEKAYDNAVEKSNEESYKSGLIKGIEQGTESGIESGVSEGKEIGLEIGLNIGKLQSNIDNLIKDAEVEAGKKQKRNRCITVAMIVTVFVVLAATIVIIFKIDPEFIDRIGIIIKILTFILPTGILRFIKNKFLCTDLGILTDKEKEKIKPELDSLGTEIRELKNNLGIKKTTI